MLQAAKQKAIDQGGKINHEFTLIKGFVYACPSLPSPSHSRAHASQIFGVTL